MLTLHIYDVIRMHPLCFTLSIEIMNLLRTKYIETVTFLKKNLEAVVRQLQHKEILIFCQFLHKNCCLLLLSIKSFYTPFRFDFFIFIVLIVRLCIQFFANCCFYVKVSFVIQNICQNFGFVASLRQLLRVFIQVILHQSFIFVPINNVIFLLAIHMLRLIT